MRRSLTLLAIATSLACPAAADGKTDSAMVVKKAKQRYYHADGYIKAIGKNARRTIYNPNRHIRTRWQKAVRYLVQIRRGAWVTLHPVVVYDWLAKDFVCIHHKEGAWNANTGNGYYGGLQMDMTFQSEYGSEYMRRWGTANNWPAWAQLAAAEKAYRSGRGFSPWPNTARACGLI